MRAPLALRPERALLREEETQLCRYRGMCCAGCGAAFRRGERVRSAGGALAHTAAGCVERATRVPCPRLEEATCGSAPMADEMEVARAHATLARLEREFALGEGLDRGGMVLPRHSRRQFERFAAWLSSDVGRRQHLGAVRLAQLTYRDKTRLQGWDSLLSGSDSE